MSPHLPCHLSLNAAVAEKVIADERERKAAKSK